MEKRNLAHSSKNLKESALLGCGFGSMNLIEFP